MLGLYGKFIWSQILRYILDQGIFEIYAICAI